MAPARINKNLLRRKMAEKDIFQFSELARRINRSPATIQFMIERPSRFTKAIGLTLDVLGIKNLSEIQETTKDKIHV